MTSYVLDASTALAWYLPESFSVSARRWQEDLLHRSARFLVPSLHFWEVGNVLRTYVRRRELDQATAEEVFSLHLDAPLEVVEPERSAVMTAAFEFEATMYDAVYISIALAFDAPLITAERTTTPWVVKLGDRVRIVG